MSGRELYRLWRQRGENPLCFRIWSARQRTFYWGIMLGSLAGASFLASLLETANDDGPFLFTLFACGAFAILPCLIFLLLGPRHKSDDNLDELQLTELTREEVAFGFVYTPIRACFFALCPVLLALFYSVCYSWFFSYSRSTYWNKVLFVFSVVIGVAAMSSLVNARRWGEKPNQSVRHFLLNTIELAFVASAWVGCAGVFLVAFLVAFDRFYLAPPTGLILLYGITAFFFSVSGIVIYRLLLNRAMSFPAALRPRLLHPWWVIPAWVLAIWLLDLDGDNEERIYGFLCAIPMAAVWLEWHKFRHFPGERTFARTDAEAYQRVHWAAPDNRRLGEHKDRLVLVYTLARRLGLRNILRENTGVFLSAILYLFLAGFLGYALHTPRFFGGDELPNRLPGVFKGIGGFPTTVALAYILPVVYMLNLARQHPRGRIPVANGAILSGAAFYSVLPTILVGLHVFIFAIIPFLRHLPSGWDDLMGALLLAGSCIPTILLVTLALIPSASRGWLALAAICAGLGLHLSCLLVMQYDHGGVYFYNTESPPYMVLVHVLLGIFAILLGIAAAAQRVHRLETAGLDRFQFNADGSTTPDFAASPMGSTAKT